MENRETIDAALQEKFSTNTTEYWIDLLQKNRVPWAINNFSETFQDEDLLKRNMIVDLLQDSGETVESSRNPVKISNHDESFVRAPKLGEHTMR